MTVSPSRWRAGGSSCTGCSTSSSGYPGRAEGVERIAQGVVDLAGVDELAQQRVHQMGRVEAIVGAGVVARQLVVRAEQLAWAEEERWSVLSTGGDNVVGRILEPGPQPAGQPRVEAGARGCVAAEERQDLGPRARVRRHVARRVRPEKGPGCDEDHRCSVPTGCDSPLP